jgi:hypothetical protein
VVAIRPAGWDLTTDPDISFRRTRRPAMSG